MQLLVQRLECSKLRAPGAGVHRDFCAEPDIPPIDQTAKTRLQAMLRAAWTHLRPIQQASAPRRLQPGQQLAQASLQHAGGDVSFLNADLLAWTCSEDNLSQRVYGDALDRLPS